MKEGVLFEITRDQLETGMRGFPIGYCTTSHVDPQKGLTYIGRPIADLCRWDPIDVIYLLYHGEPGRKDQVTEFRRNINHRAFCSEETIRHIRALPQKGSAMDLFAAALLIAGVYESNENYREDCLNVIAKLPQIVATLINHHAGWGETPPPNPDLGYVENFIHMLRLPTPKTEQFTEVLRMFNITHYDHGGGNLSTFVGKAVASALEPMYGSLAGAMTALAGPRHGGANEDCLAFMQLLVKELGDELSEEHVAHWLRRRLERNELIFGFGHAVLRVEDPRATLFYHYGLKEFPNHPLIRAAALLRKVGPKILSENKKISNPFPNIDAITGPLLTAVGFPYPDYFPLLFGLSRCVGIAIQIVYERVEARGGKGTPIVRPDYLYKSREQISHAVKKAQ
jgi:citrate synthase